VTGLWLSATTRKVLLKGSADGGIWSWCDENRKKSIGRFIPIDVGRSVGVFHLIPVGYTYDKIRVGFALQIPPRECSESSFACPSGTVRGSQANGTRENHLQTFGTEGFNALSISLQLGIRRCCYGVTRNCLLLVSVPEGVVTVTKPVLAPVGTVVVIKELETTVKTAAVPLNVTLVAPVRLVPRILTAAPTLPEVGCVSTNSPRPTDSLKTVPQPQAGFPPAYVVP